MNERILLVDDDKELTRLLKEGLLRDGFDVQIVETIDEAKYALINRYFDIAILDVNLAEMVTVDSDQDRLEGISLRNVSGDEGFELAAWARINFPEVRIIMLSARRTVLADRVHGLDLGADDYITKPADYPDVRARIRALLRRKKPAARNTILFSNWKFNIASHELESPTGELLSLSPAESQLLQSFIENEGSILSREILTKKIFGRDLTKGDRAIDTLVKKLRDKIDRELINSSYIRTIHGSGYKFNSNTLQIE